MNQIYKTASALILSVILLSAMGISAAAVLGGEYSDIPSPADSFVISDTSAGISVDTHKLYYKTANALYGLTGIQIAVLAVDEIGYQELEDTLYKWDAEDTQNSTGIVFVMELSAKSFFVKYGEGLSWLISGDMLQQIYDSGVSEAFDKGDYDSAAQIFCKEMTDCLRSLYHIDTDTWNRALQKFDNAAESLYGNNEDTAPSDDTIPAWRNKTILRVAFILFVIFLCIVGYRLNRPRQIK